MTNSVVGRSPTRELDSNGMEVGSLSSFLGAIRAFADAQRPTDISINLVKNHHEHLVFSFAMTMTKETLIELMEGSKLTFTVADAPDEKMVIVTGTLKDWFLFTVNRKSRSANAVAVKVWLLFKKLGLGAVWSDVEYNEQHQKLTYK